MITSEREGIKSVKMILFENTLDFFKLGCGFIIYWKFSIGLWVYH